MSMFGGVIETLREASVFALRRHEILAENVANVETPGFRARDVAFEHELSIAQKARALPAPGIDANSLELRVVDRPDFVTKPDGNTVDIDRQMTRMAQNTLYHNAVIQLLNSRFNALKSAINGR